MQKPKVIFLDAVGTLFGVKNSVGDIYSQIAQQFNVDVEPQQLNKIFTKSFQAAPPPIFPNTDSKDISEKEYHWWYRIVFNTFADAGVVNQFANFSDFFSELYVHFSTSDPWYVYPDVPLALVNWRRLGIELGILSNFDSRLYLVLQSLGLKEYFNSITISTQVCAAKPDLKIFKIALEKHNCYPEAAWHIGDSLKDDYEGAKAVGMRGIWLNRHLSIGNIKN